MVVSKFGTKSCDNEKLFKCLSCYTDGNFIIWDDLFVKMKTATLLQPLVILYFGTQFSNGFSYILYIATITVTVSEMHSNIALFHRCHTV